MICNLVISLVAQWTCPGYDAGQTPAEQSGVRQNTLTELPMCVKEFASR